MNQNTQDDVFLINASIKNQTFAEPNLIFKEIHQQWWGSDSWWWMVSSAALLRITKMGHSYTHTHTRHTKKHSVAKY